MAMGPLTLNVPVNLVLFYCGIRTGHFGAGSHIENLLPFIKEQTGIRLTIIKTDVRLIREVNFITEDGVDVLSIPQPENKLFITTEDNPVQKTYARRIVDIIYPYVCNKSNLVFWVNSIDYLNVGEVLKETFKSAKLLYVHHAWSWKCFINVSDEIFSAHWNRSNINFHPQAFEYTTYQQKMAKLADHVVPVTNQAANFFKNVLGVDPPKVTTIYNGIPKPETHLFTKGELREKYGFRSDEKIILYTGRIKAEKGISYLLSAFKKIAEEQHNVRLILAGSGDFADFIGLACPYWSKVIYTGELHSDQINELYQLADIGVLPSLFEQCSFTAIEMRFYKLPVIVSCVDGLDEMFEDGVDALKLTVQCDSKGCRVLDPDEIAKKINLLLSNNEMSLELQQNGYEKALKYFTAQKMGSAYLKVIRNLIPEISSVSQLSH